jgi:hypothetical protein
MSNVMRKVDNSYFPLGSAATNAVQRPAASRHANQQTAAHFQGTGGLSQGHWHLAETLSHSRFAFDVTEIETWLM